MISHTKRFTNSRKQNKQNRLSMIEYSLNDAIGGGFSWCESPEGVRYWADIVKGIIPKKRELD